MLDERQRLLSDHLIDEGVKVADVAREAVADMAREAVADVAREAVAVGLGAGRDLVRVAHADEIRRDQPAAGGLDVRQDTSPQERGGRVAVKEHDRVPHAAFDIGHPAAEHFSKTLFACPGAAYGAR